MAVFLIKLIFGDDMQEYLLLITVFQMNPKELLARWLNREKYAWGLHDSDFSIFNQIWNELLQWGKCRGANNSVAQKFNMEID